MDVQYIGRAGRRVIRASDLEGQGITGFETTTWLKLETKTVQDAGGKWLVDNLPAEFKENQTEEPATTLSASTKSARNAPAESASTTSSKG